MATLYERLGSNHWWYQIRLDGKQIRGSSTKTDDKKLAERITNAVQTDCIRDRFNLPAEKPEKIFGNVCSEYINHLNSSKNTIETKKFYAKHFLPEFENKKLSDITTSDIKNYLLKRKLEVLSMPKNVGKKDSIENSILAVNSASKIKKLNELKRIKTLSNEDIQKLISGATNKLTRDLITFSIYTCCRKGETLNFKQDDIDFKNDVIGIKGTKTGNDRYIPISKPFKTLLNDIDKELYAFNNNGAKLTDFKRSLHTAYRNAGLKDLHIPDLRHVFASKMVMGEASLYITGELLGHKTIQMTKRYSHLVPDTLKKAVDGGI